MRLPFFLLLSACSLFIISCRKGELPEANYFGKIEVTNIDFPNAPAVDVRFEAKTLGTIAASKYETYNLNVGQGRLKIYKANTDTLLADTLVTLEKNTQQSFRFGYSEEFGFKGFLYSGPPISQDTVVFQVLNNLGDYYKTYSIDLHICVFNFDTGTPDETGYVFQDFMKTRLSATTVRVPFASADGTPYYYVGRLYDRTTGTYITLPSGNDFFLFLQEYGGAYYIYNVHDDAGDVSSSTIYL